MSEQIYDLDLGSDEREGYQLKPVSPEEGYVKDVYLLAKPTFEKAKNSDSMLLIFKFGTQDGGNFTCRISDPFNSEKPKTISDKIAQLKHIVGAFIRTPYVDKVVNGVKVKVKPELFQMKFSSFEELCIYLISVISDGAEQIPCTMKLVSNNGGSQFPLYPKFIANAWNLYIPEKHFSWNPAYDKLTSAKAGSSNTPDTEGGDDEPNYA